MEWRSQRRKPPRERAPNASPPSLAALRMTASSASVRYLSRRCCQTGLRRMEPLWSPVVATGRNWSQMPRARRPRNQAKTVAVGCERLRKAAHGKEGVAVRVRQRALQKRRKPALFSRGVIAKSPACSWMEHFLELSDFDVAK